ncbi:MAG: S41 family peptidase [Longimicrobiales bacterium]
MTAPTRKFNGRALQCRPPTVPAHSAHARQRARRRAVFLIGAFALAGCAAAAQQQTAVPTVVRGTGAASGRSAEPVATTIALATFDTAWSRIARLHYDSTFNGVDWDAVRQELRPRAAAAATIGALRAVVSGMLERLGESHYALIPGESADAIEPGEESDTTPSGVPGDVGMSVRVVGGLVVVTRIDPSGAAAAAGVRPGWAVERIGEQSLGDALERLFELEGAERRIASTRFVFRVNEMLTGDAGTVASLRFLDGEDRRVTLDLTRRPRPGEPVRFGNLPAFFAVLKHERIVVDGACVGVIRFSVWMLPLAAAFDQAIDDVRDCDGVVIDLRGNPGGVAGMVMGVAGHFFDEVTPLGILRSRGTELKLVANPRLVNRAGQRVEPFAGRVAILTDAASVSTSEIFAAGMQSNRRARIFGDTTAGQALPAVAVRLPNGDVLMHVIADLTGPDGRRIEGSGVAPDVMVPLTRAGLLAGHDAPLEAAIRWIAGRPAARRMGTLQVPSPALR